jgi:pSer/pThr/pTyr-binding forkhead associated (FHA) protein
MARLFLTLNNQVLSHHFILSGKEVTIGRGPDNRIIIDHPAVSLKHAMIVHDEQGLHLSDLGSSNGTMVNNERVMSCQLAHQDWVVVGKYLIVVDLYETLSLEAAAHMLKTQVSGVADADGTMLLNMDMSQPSTQSFDYLSFMSEKAQDFELSDRPVYIGKNKDADIFIKGLWKFLSGEPTATIEKHSGDYYLEFVSGMLRPKVNNKPIQKPTKLNHHDEIKIGPLRIQFHRTRLALSP